jgi:hypothetical protein
MKNQAQMGLEKRVSNNIPFSIPSKPFIQSSKDWGSFTALKRGYQIIFPSRYRCHFSFGVKNIREVSFL